ncbi:peptide deformylase [Ligilactobacillus aviarius]|uniref:peptide deformylase n=1 Tax=Ligilactobacillus aviarius TaxID=1606 RepID=UPI0024B8DA56|nr:peptide deformylase [Ligilactobacillus aviarius]
MITMDNIIREGHPTLRKRAEKLTFPLSEEDQKLAHDLMEFLENSQDEKIAEKYHLRAGVGLAAPQVDRSIRMTAVLVPGAEGEKPIFKHVLVNPTIVSESVQKAALAEGEGCLSVDRDVPGYVPRADRIKLRWFDLDGNEHVQRLKDYPAIVVQHEIDHLNGILFFDHINKDNPFSAPEGTLILE